MAKDLQEEFGKDLQRFGENIRQRRAERGISLDVLAEETGICKAYLSRLERQERHNPSFIMVYVLASYFELDIQDIITKK